MKKIDMKILIGKFKNRSIVIVTILVILLVVGGIVGGLMLTKDADTGSTEVETVTIVDKDTGEEKEVKADNKEAEDAKKGKNVVVKENKSSNNTSNKNSLSSSSSKKDNNSSSGNKDTGTKPSNSSKPSESTKPSEPVHKHSWVAVYKEVDNGYYKTVTEKIPYKKCTGCGADITNNSTDHHYNHAINGEASGTTTAYRYTESKVWISDIQKVVDYYKCACGATK